MQELSIGYEKLDLVGQKFGLLTCLRIAESKGGKSRFEFLCECGVIKTLNGHQVKIGNHKSCGCNRAPRKTYEYKEHPLYDVWKGIKARCRDKKHSSYVRYGGKGVKVCKEWESNFMAFYNWAIENGWERGMQIDKDIIPNKLGIPALIYSPDMCSIVTRLENVRVSKHCKINKEIADEIRRTNLSSYILAKKYSVNPTTIQRIRNNKLWK